jgi:hypothetical protein
MQIDSITLALSRTDRVRGLTYSIEMIAKSGMLGFREGTQHGMSKRCLKFHRRYFFVVLGLTHEGRAFAGTDIAPLPVGIRLGGRGKCPILTISFPKDLRVLQVFFCCVTKGGGQRLHPSLCPRLSQPLFRLSPLAVPTPVSTLSQVLACVGVPGCVKS